MSGIVLHSHKKLSKLFTHMNRRYALFLLIVVHFTNLYAQEPVKTADYHLPDALKTSQGQIVNTVSDWEKKRRPVILILFEDNIYGQMPDKYEAISFEVTREEPAAMDGKAHLKEVAITVRNNRKPLTIHLVLFTPTSALKPSGVFLLINNRETQNTDPSRKIKSGFWPAEMLIDSGYAIAAFHISNASPDDKNDYRKGVLELYPDQLTADNGMKAIGAWAWAASRVMDYFKTNPDIDFSKVCIVGHSRGGKASLWAGAQDTRFAVVFSSCSGNTGAALSRRQSGETIKVINTNFPHWFNNNYKKYNENVNVLPVDQHMLISLLAPRPVYTTNATEDLWADPVGSYISLLEARSVYGLYGKSSGLTLNVPVPDSPIIRSIMGYHIRKGNHDLTAYDWINFIRFANYHFDSRNSGNGKQN